jgi:flagellar hook-associated protein 3 FlgL
VDKLATALSTNNVAGIQGAISAIDNAQNQIVAARTDVGARMNRVQSASDNLESLKVSQNKSISDKQDVDFLQVMSDLSNQQTAFQAALQSVAKTSKLSLLDYM